MKTGSNLQGSTALPKPFFNSFGKKVLEFISPTEIVLDLPFIMTRNKRLSINLPYLKIEQKLSGDDIDAIRLLNFDESDGFIRLYVQELESNKSYTLEWNMEYTGSYGLWSLTDFETAICFSRANNSIG